jgi:uncharacterized protein
MFELSIFGIFTGFISGFFGIGGGMVLIPILLYYGFNMKEAISISIMQMVFSSIFGSFLNYKQNKSILKTGLLLGFGGFLGALNSGFIINNMSSDMLSYIFMAIISYTIFKILNQDIIITKKQPIQNNKILLIIGFFVGLIAISIGVGGAILITPILAVYLNYDLKTASSMALFFVVFSSVAGFISLSLNNQMLYTEGFIIGLASLLGVFVGIKLKNMVNIHLFKKYIIILYIIILTSMIFKIFIV